MCKYIFTFILMSYASITFAQTKWNSPNYGYSIEIPSGFSKTSSIGNNVDFKAVKGSNSIVIVMKTIPNEYASYSIWELMGNLETFGSDWENGAREYMNNPKFLKYGKTKIDNYDAFWYDYTTENPKLYSKTYQIQKGNKIYTITLTSEFDEYNSYSAVWYRFKEQIKL